MLLFSSDTFTVNGITVFPDHADPSQFWYLPGPVGLELESGSTEPQFLLIMYAPDVAGNGIQGSGFLNVTTALTVSDMTQTQIIGQIRTQFPNVDSPKLAPVSFDTGTVQIVALDLQGAGGTSASAAAPGTGQAVERILGASSPELFGNNDAVFGLTLTEEGATILEEAFKDGMTPVGAIYNMQFTGVLPALDVKITCDLKRAYNSFSVDLTASAYFVSAGIDATFEQLRQDGVIQIDVISLSSDAATQSAETWALNLFKDQIMSTWFAPSLGPTTAAAADAQSVNLPTKTAAGTSSAPASSAQSAKPAQTMGGATPSNSSSMSSAKPASSSMGASGGATTATATPPAVGATPQASLTTPATPSAPSVPSPAKPTTPATPAKPTTPAAKPAAQAAGTAAAASSAASPFGVALRLKYVSQDELKTVEYEYNQMNAVQRTYSPQGYFGLLLQNLDQSKHFLKVDGTDPFFNNFAVTINPPHDFTGIGLLSAHVGLDYGDPSSAAGVKHGDFVFDPQHTAQQTWAVFQGLIQSTSYTYTIDYEFDPESGWQGEKTSYTLPPVTTENRLLTLNPFDTLGFVQISIQPGRIDPGTVDRIEVPLQYTAASGWTTSQTIVVRPGAPAQSFDLRLADSSARSYTYSTNCYLKDGTLISSPATTTTASALIVNDPFAGGLNLTFQPAFDPNAINLAIVELSYKDSTNNYTFQTTFQMNGTSQPMQVHVPVIDPTQNQYQYRITLLDHANQKTQGNYITAQDSLVLVSAGS
jgi:hypothetical protein